MAGGYPVKSDAPLGPLLDQLASIQRQLNELAQPTGTSMSSLVNQVNVALQNIDQTVQAAISQYSYTKAQVNALVASPGNIAPANVTANGNVQAAGQVISAIALNSPGSRNYLVTTSYVAGWINGDGTLGTSPSGRAVKRDLAAMVPDEVTRLLALTPYHGRFIWDDDDAPLKTFLVAEDLVAADLGDDLVATVQDEELGEVPVINYPLLVVPLLAAVQQLAARVSALEPKET
jgi:hypothetical protein